jgi:hypothetical protein
MSKHRPGRVVDRSGDAPGVRETSEQRREGLERMWRCHSLPTRAAFHEAGHTVAAHYFDVPIVRVSIEHTPYPRLTTGNYLKHAPIWAENFAMLTLAGPAAEGLNCDEDTSDAAAHDARARRYLATLQLDPPQVEAELMRLHGRARWFVRTEWAQKRILSVAEALLERGMLSGEDVKAVCGPGCAVPGCEFIVKPDSRFEWLAALKTRSRPTR